MGNRSTEQKAGLPADTLGGRAQLLQGPVLDLTNALLADPQQVPDLAQAGGAVPGRAEAHVEHLALARVLAPGASGSDCCCSRPSSCKWCGDRLTRWLWRATAICSVCRIHQVA